MVIQAANWRTWTDLGMRLMSPDGAVMVYRPSGRRPYEVVYMSGAVWVSRDATAEGDVAKVIGDVYAEAAKRYAEISQDMKQALAAQASEA